MTKNMQAAFSSGGGAPGQGMDPSQYMQAMQQMMQDPMMARVMQSMQNPNARSQMESRMAQLKEDP